MVSNFPEAPGGSRARLWGDRPTLHPRADVGLWNVPDRKKRRKDFFSSFMWAARWITDQRASSRQVYWFYRIPVWGEGEPRLPQRFRQKWGSSSFLASETRWTNMTRLSCERLSDQLKSSCLEYSSLSFSENRQSIKRSKNSLQWVYTEANK